MGPKWLNLPFKLFSKNEGGWGGWGGGVKGRLEFSEVTDEEATDEEATDEEATDEEAKAMSGWLNGWTEISGRPCGANNTMNNI